MGEGRGPWPPTNQPNTTHSGESVEKSRLALPNFSMRDLRTNGFLQNGVNCWKQTCLVQNGSHTQYKGSITIL